MGFDTIRGDRAIFWDARAGRRLMMGSGEDTTDKIERDGWCRVRTTPHGTFQHGPSAAFCLRAAPSPQAIRVTVSG
jgi:hypothetical protein